MSHSNNKTKRTPIYYNGPTVTLDVLEEDGSVTQRQGVIKYLYLSDIALIDATDALSIEPRLFFVRGGINWHAYLQGLTDCWKYHFPVPYQFKFLKKVHPDIIENFSFLPFKEKQVVLESLRHNRFLPKLRMLKNGNQPKDLDWEEVARLCLRTVPYIPPEL
ncbi:MAG: hypothetical protein OCC49_03260 [Fibrobacterales bacterium]